MKVDSNIHGPTLAKLRRKYRLNYFVETGTATGTTTELAACCFDRVFSCELDTALYNKAVEHMQPYNNVQLYNLPSPEFIRLVKPQVSQPAMWWLDAHWCGSSIKPPRECPLLEELLEVKGTHGHSVILIDDANYMRSPPPPPHNPSHWPTMEDIYRTINTWGEAVTYDLIKGPRTEILVITPNGI